ncbi:unnamed protein product [Hymenolepis diminuta]|uniref:Uncharacterized protein n=1 Tax=Hymenolepis diminuta TaxID=6216 RepID=A0A564Y8F2_HYMDI|nr:unnamed protein product [Hymenolepis diminuta]
MDSGDSGTSSWNGTSEDFSTADMDILIDSEGEVYFSAELPENSDSSGEEPSDYSDSPDTSTSAYSSDGCIASSDTSGFESSSDVQLTVPQVRQEMARDHETGIDPMGLMPEFLLDVEQIMEYVQSFTVNDLQSDIEQRLLEEQNTST